MTALITATAPRAITVTNSNLFAVAASELNDATQWDRIARLNGMTDPFFTGTITLTIPPINTAAGTGGVLG